MPQNALFQAEAIVAQRQPKTDRLVLQRLLDLAIADAQLTDELLRPAHAVLVKWAEHKSSGRLATFNETQMQGDFLAEFFGQALGYAGWTEEVKIWHRIQHHSIAGQEPDAVLGFFEDEKPREPLGVVELKGPKVHLDRDRSNGRTAVEQCWDFLNHTPPEF